MAKDELEFIFDGKRLKAREGDTIASALWRNRIKVITRSIKFHRPRGLHCGTGDCSNCLANVNGIPNVRACTTLVKAGMVVRPQNKFISRNFDPIGIIDILHKNGFNYHDKFIRPRFASGIYQRIIRKMTGIGKLPSAQVNARPHRRLAPELLIIGDEFAGIRVAEMCSGEDIDTVLVRRDISDESLIKLNSRANLRVLSRSSLAGAFDDGSIGIVVNDQLLIFKPMALCLAETGREMPLRFVNWDMPGIIQSKAAEQLLRNGVPLGNDIVLVGDASKAMKLAKEIADRGLRVRSVLCEGAISLCPDGNICIKSNWQVSRAIGRKQLKRIEITNGTRTETLDCDCLITCGRMLPNIELARQLGCSIMTDKNLVPYVSVNEEFETSIRGIFALGSSINCMDSTKAMADALVAAKAIVRRIWEMKT